ncbi:MAG: hypothetical protein V5A52_05125 [Halovenus sp.]|uniref:hypothetical protein n=1 Tax=Halovenus amylolytica TaxID=2500550 RepID=UPI000FE2F91F
MAVSRNTEHSHELTFWERLFDQLTRYDLVLTAIPVLFTIAAVVSILFAISFHVTVAGGAVLSLTLVFDVLFFNPPIENRR